MNNPFFSVVITCCNYERYIRRCIESVFLQSFKNFEIIVVNAGSTDNSYKFISSYKEIVKVSAPKGFHSVACFSGLKKCKGKWVLFLDADDFLFKSALRNVRNTIRPGFIKVQFNLRICDKDGNYSRREMVTFPKNYNTEQIKKDFEKTGTYSWPVTSGNVYLHSFLKEVFPLNRFLPVDGQLNTIAPAFGDVGQINNALGCYRLHNQNMDNRSLNPWDPKRFQYNIKRRYKEFFYARKTAHFLNKKFPLKPFLNHELTFISYRIFLRKLGTPYFMHGKERAWILYGLFVKVFLRKSFLLSYGIISFFWFFVFIFAPKDVAFWLLKRRFSRGV